jgi:putative Mg2+ transporter-C (MgtC) family protein
MDDALARISRVIAEEFSDIHDLEELTRVTVRLLLAAFLGGLLGFERETARKHAGLRTHMLVSVGAALFVLVAERSGIEPADLSRVIQGVIAGVGFLCAGAILKSASEDQVRGLTTSAGLWMTAAIGVAAGLGRDGLAVLCTLLTWCILEMEGPLRRWLHRSEADPGSPREP